jgi:hypothetical protein
MPNFLEQLVAERWRDADPDRPCMAARDLSALEEPRRCIPPRRGRWAARRDRHWRARLSCSGVRIGVAERRALHVARNPAVVRTSAPVVRMPAPTPCPVVATGRRSRRRCRIVAPVSARTGHLLTAAAVVAALSGRITRWTVRHEPIGARSSSSKNEGYDTELHGMFSRWRPELTRLILIDG